MATTRIKEKLSKLVPSQLPEFIQSEYTTFVAFLEAYYEFLEQDQGAQELLQNARSYNDIDRTVDSFINYFLKQYGNNIPRDILADKKLLVKNLKDLYNNKGNAKSYELLFKILFNIDSELFFPSSQILKASDGKWFQKTSFFMRTLVGTGDEIVGKNLIITSPTTRYPIFVSAKKDALSSAGISSSIHEYFFNNSKNVPVNVGDIIEFEGFKGVVVGIPASATIIKAGSGFRVGDILTLTSGTGVTARLKVKRVTTTGGIRAVQFISFGIGYGGDFYNFFSPASGRVVSSTFSYIDGVASIAEKTSGFVERGTITTPTYAVTGFFAEDYQGDLLREFFTSTYVDESTSLDSATGGPSDAAIFIELGSKAFYPGYFDNNDGFISDDMYLEDRDYYQPFSYVIKVDERLSDYKKAVLDLLHPAGAKLFGELTLNVPIDISAEITTALRYLTLNLQEVVGEIEDTVSKLIIKPVTDSSEAIDSNAKTIIKPFEESTVLTDILTSLLGRPVLDLLDVSDATSIEIDSLIDGTGDYAIDYFLEDYTISLDTVVITDSINVVLTPGP